MPSEDNTPGWEISGSLVFVQSVQCELHYRKKFKSFSEVVRVVGAGVGMDISMAISNVCFLSTHFPPRHSSSCRVALECLRAWRYLDKKQLN